MQNMIFVLYPLFCILLPCMLYVLIQTKGFHQRTNFIHMIWVFIFLYYVYLVLETTGIGTIWEIGLYPGMKLQEEINLIPFRDGISLSMICLLYTSGIRSDRTAAGREPETSGAFE